MSAGASARTVAAHSGQNVRVTDVTKPTETTEKAEATTEPPTAPAPAVVIRELPPVTERELAARRRGLSSAYIAGGDDPDPERTRREEARYIRLLILMIALIVGSGLVVTFVGLILAGPGPAQ
jgi:hypothetical protein